MKDSWKVLPNLQSERHCSGVFTFNNTYVYSVCGNKNELYINSIEKLNITRHTEWEFVGVSNMMSIREAIHAIQISPTEVLVFGGFPRKTDCYLLMMGDKIKCIESSNMTEGGSFYCCAAPLFVDTCVYASDIDKRIHIFSTIDKKWDVID